MENSQFVFELLRKTTQNVFLTGKAGTGKTTLLQEIKKSIEKNLVVVAPTSVAAINAGGVTMHSFFQIPFGPIIPQQPVDLTTDQSLHRYSPEKLSLIRSLELIIIDEISMVRADQLDYIDFCLRRINMTNQPFGGIQLLLIGDPLQLPPIKDNWAILSRYYASPYFFESLALKRSGFVAVELTQVHRQSDPEFIALLNAVRKGQVSPSILTGLNQRYSMPTAASDQQYITITTHHKIVNAINQENLDQLDGDAFIYKASITGDYPADASIAEETLVLKVGARVIMIKNDDSGKKAYFNGRVARVCALSQNGVMVEFQDDGSRLELAPQTWHHIKYSLHDGESQVAETNAGSFTQYPVKPAWAITVHKSQGLTFDQVNLDLSGCFEPGQAYVALSRCRSLEGIQLRTLVGPESIKTDQTAVDFMTGIQAPQMPEIFIRKSEITGEHMILQEIFDFSAIDDRLNAVDGLISKSRAPLDLSEVLAAMRKQVIRPARKFLNDEIFKLRPDVLPQDQNGFGSRLETAAGYFISQLNLLPEQLTHIAKGVQEKGSEVFRLADMLPEVLFLLSIKLASFEGLLAGMPLPVIRKNARIMRAKPVKRPDTKDTEETPLLNAALYEQLVQWRRAYSSAKSLPVHIVLADKTLRKIAEKAPRSVEQLAALPGIGPAKARDIGEQLVDLINHYFGTKELF